MLSKLKRKVLAFKFNKKFVQFNRWTFRAFKVNSDEEFKKLCWQCAEETAKDNKKDIKEVSLEDIYTVLYKIRKRCPKLLRKITLYQVIKLKSISSSVSDAFSIIYSISGLTLVPIVYVGLKKIFGNKMEYAFKMYVFSLIFQSIYAEKR